MFRYKEFKKLDRKTVKLQKESEELLKLIENEVERIREETLDRYTTED